MKSDRQRETRPSVVVEPLGQILRIMWLCGKVLEGGMRVVEEEAQGTLKEADYGRTRSGHMSNLFLGAIWKTNAMCHVCLSDCPLIFKFPYCCMRMEYTPEVGPDGQENSITVGAAPLDIYECESLFPGAATLLHIRKTVCNCIYTEQSTGGE